MMYAVPDTPATIPTLTTDESNRLKAEFPNIATPANCLTCGGRGVFHWRDPETGEPCEWKCNCPEQWVLHRYLLNCGIGTHYQRLGWVDVSAEQSAVESVLRYMEQADFNLRTGVNLVLHGPMGNGKTLLGILLLKGLLAQGHDGYFTTFSKLLSKLMDSWSSREEAQYFYARIRNAGFLVIDDVGREHKQKRMVAGEGMKSFNTATAEFAFEDIMRHRIGMALPTVITSNLSLDQLATHYGPNLMSLLDERSIVVPMRGPDFRPEAKSRLDAEIKSGLVRPVVLG